MKVYAYKHPQLNILCCALFPDAVPHGVSAVELDVETPADVVLDNDIIRVKSDAEKLQDVKQDKINQLKSYTSVLLAPTDYIVIKIAEAQALGDANQLDTLKQKYSAQLQQRESIRAWSEQTKQAINNANTIDDINAISITYGG